MNPEAKKEAENKRYHLNSEAKKEAENKRYHLNPEQKKEAENKRYQSCQGERKCTMRNYYNRCRSSVLLHRKSAYYCPTSSKIAARLVHRAKKCMRKKTAAYSLHEPKQHTIELYVKIMKQMLSKNAAIRRQLNSAFEAASGTGKMKTNSKLANAVSNIAVRKVVYKALRMRSVLVSSWNVWERLTIFNFQLMILEIVTTQHHQSHIFMMKVMLYANLKNLFL